MAAEDRVVKYKTLFEAMMDQPKTFNTVTKEEYESVTKNFRPFQILYQRANLTLSNRFFKEAIPQFKELIGMAQKENASELLKFTMYCDLVTCYALTGNFQKVLKVTSKMKTFNMHLEDASKFDYSGTYQRALKIVLGNLREGGDDIACYLVNGSDVVVLKGIAYFFLGRSDLAVSWLKEVIKMINMLAENLSPLRHHYSTWNKIYVSRIYSEAILMHLGADFKPHEALHSGNILKFIRSGAECIPYLRNVLCHYIDFVAENNDVYKHRKEDAWKVKNSLLIRDNFEAAIKSLK